MNIEVEVDKQSLAWALSRMNRDELVGLLVEIDGLVAEVEFTEELVTKLVTSLKNDKEDVSIQFIDWGQV